jgi:hypothetical protein
MNTILVDLIDYLATIILVWENECALALFGRQIKVIVWEKCHQLRILLIPAFIIVWEYKII